MADQTSQRNIRRRITFSGRVQGVGFRFTTCQVAADYPVTGFVRNLPSGNVEVVAEGPTGAIDQFVRRLSSRMSGNIEDIRTSESSATGEFEQFEVRF